jgi:hypothetical protein
MLDTIPSRFRPIHRGDKPPSTLNPQPSTEVTCHTASVALNPQPSTGSKGLKKISFAKPAKKEETKTDYPVFTDPNPQRVVQVAEIAARIKTRSGEIEALEGAQDTDKAELRMFVAPFYFTVNRGKPEPPSSISIPSTAGEVLVTFQNRYTKITDESALDPILGDQLDKWFRQAFSLSIKGELLPDGQAQDIVNEIQAVLAAHNAMDALDVKEEIKPVKEFHVARHTAFTPQVNMAIEQACPIVAMIKTKGRGSK